MKLTQFWTTVDCDSSVLSTFAGGGCCGSHGAAGAAGEEFGVAYSLYTKVDMERLECLSEAHDNSCRNVFRPWDQRLEDDKASATPITQ